jgi:hypothetical protein
MKHLSFCDCEQGSSIRGHHETTLLLTRKTEIDPVRYCPYLFCDSHGQFDTADPGVSFHGRSRNHESISVGSLVMDAA